MPPSSSLGMDIEFKSPWSFFVRVPKASIVCTHSSCLEVKGVIGIHISLNCIMLDLNNVVTWHILFYFSLVVPSPTGSKGEGWA